MPENNKRSDSGNASMGIDNNIFGSIKYLMPLYEKSLRKYCDHNQDLELTAAYSNCKYQNRI